MNRAAPPAVNAPAAPPRLRTCRRRPRFARNGLVFAGVLFALLAAPAAEIQQHGFLFEEWVRTTFFADYRAETYTQQWDIPAGANREHGNVPVNPKAVRYGGPVHLGDALRQFDIAEPFILVIGYWRQEGPAKRFVNIVSARIEPAVWRKLWGPITRADLERLDALIKDRSRSPAEVRAAVRAMKRSPAFRAAVMRLNAKIDGGSQRRLQCSLRFADVFDLLAPDTDRRPQVRASLWGVEFPGPLASPPRSVPRASAAGAGSPP